MTDAPKPPVAPAEKPIPEVLMTQPTRAGAALDHARDRLIRLAR